jgi:hypothetical protein
MRRAHVARDGRVTAMLHVTLHAVERFIRRWRPGTPFAEARALLEKVAANAVATRRRTIRRDAWIYTSLTDAGETIQLAVRDSTVVTVLDRACERGCTEGEWLDPDGEMFAESAATRAACQAILAEAFRKKEATQVARRALDLTRAKTRRPR